MIQRKLPPQSPLLFRLLRHPKQRNCITQLQKRTAEQREKTKKLGTDGSQEKWGTNKRTGDGWLAELFRKIVWRAKELLQDMIRNTQLPPKPTLQLDIAEIRHMQKLMAKAQAEANAIRTLQDVELPKLQAQHLQREGAIGG